MKINRQLGQNQYTASLRAVPQGMAATRTSLMRLLKSMDLVGWSKNEESGRLDRRAFAKFASGSANVFSRREMIEADTSAVSVLIDCSSSMRSGEPTPRINVARDVAIQLSSILHRARVAFAVTGFRAGNGKAYRGGVAIETPTFIPFKRWNETLQQRTAVLGYIDEFALGGTPDYSAISNAIEELHRRPEGRRVLILLTDADGYYRKHMQHLQSLADKVGVTIVAIGIESNDVLKCFTNAAVVKNLSDLGAATMGQMLRSIK